MLSTLDKLHCINVNFVNNLAKITAKVEDISESFCGHFSGVVVVASGAVTLWDVLSADEVGWKG